MNTGRFYQFIFLVDLNDEVSDLQFIHPKTDQELTQGTDLCKLVPLKRQAEKQTLSETPGTLHV